MVRIMDLQDLFPTKPAVMLSHNERLWIVFFFNNMKNKNGYFQGNTVRYVKTKINLRKIVVNLTLSRAKTRQNDKMTLIFSKKTANPVKSEKNGDFFYDRS